MKIAPPEIPSKSQAKRRQFSAFLYFILSKIYATN